MTDRMDELMAGVHIGEAQAHIREAWRHLDEARAILAWADDEQGRKDWESVNDSMGMIVLAMEKTNSMFKREGE